MTLGTSTVVYGEGLDLEAMGLWIMLDDTTDSTITSGLTDDILSILQILRFDDPFRSYRHSVGRAIEESLPIDLVGSPLLARRQLIEGGHV